VGPTNLHVQAVPDTVAQECMQPSSHSDSSTCGQPLLETPEGNLLQSHAQIAKLNSAQIAYVTEPSSCAAIDFLGEEVVQRHMNGAGRASLLRRIQAASKNDMELDHALKAYGAGRSSAAAYSITTSQCGLRLWLAVRAYPATIEYRTLTAE
jgi:hypothetical protein